MCAYVVNLSIIISVTMYMVGWVCLCLGVYHCKGLLYVKGTESGGQMKSELHRSTCIHSCLALIEGKNKLHI